MLYCVYHKNSSFQLTSKMVWLHTSLIYLLVCLLNIAISQKCVQVENCESYSNLLNYLSLKTQGEDEYGLDKIKVLQHLKTIKCDDSDAYEPKIWCDDVVELENILVENDKLITTTTEEPTDEFYEDFEGIEERFLGGSGVMVNRHAETECIGVLKLTHLSSKILKSTS